MEHTYILVVDDDEKIIKFLRFNLSGEGWHILTARDGVEAMHIVEKETPDLILLDIMLPEVDGFEVCRQIRATMPEMWIIMLTIRGQEVDRVMGLELGADDYMIKPFSLLRGKVSVSSVSLPTIS